VDRRQTLPAIHPRMRARFELIVAEPPAIVRGVVVGEVDVVVGPQALGHHQVMRLVAVRRILPVRGQRPDHHEHGETGDQRRPSCDA
jgi:hypothetical protein